MMNRIENTSDNISYVGWVCPKCQIYVFSEEDHICGLTDIARHQEAKAKDANWMLYAKLQRIAEALERIAEALEGGG